MSGCTDLPKLRQWGDAQFSYKTIKFVDIQDWKLGLSNLLFKILIFLYICGYVILYNCTHLLSIPIEGSVRMTIQHPTQHCNPTKPQCHANFKPLSELPYCSQYEPSHNLRHEPARRLSRQLKEKNMQRRCVYHDGMEITPDLPTPGMFFVPTRISTIKQIAGCDIESPDGCDNVFDFTDDSKVESIYIPDVADFTLLVDHAFHTFGLEDEITGTAGDLVGYMHIDKNAQMPENFETKDHIEGVIVPQKSGDLAHENFNVKDKTAMYPSVIHLGIGDVISVADLIKLADPAGFSLLDALRENGETLRWNGGVLQISIVYSNEALMDPFGQTPIQYKLSVSFLPMSKFKQQYGDRQSDGTRVIADVHGILILAQVSGNLKVPDPGTLLTVLTTSLVLLASSNLIVDTLMVYTMHFGVKYRIMKNQATYSFSKLRSMENSVKEKHGADWSLTEHKTQPHSRLFHNFIGDNPETIESYFGSADLCYLVMKFDQRLNRVDAMDEFNLCWKEGAEDKVATFVSMYESRHWDDANIQQPIRDHGPVAPAE